MNPLVAAIFTQDPERVREIAVSFPELLTERSDSGLLPFELARSAGYVRVATALLRLAPPETQVNDYDVLLESYLRDLSHSYACAGWLDEIEYLVWCICEGEDLPIHDSYEFRRIPPQQRSDLMFLSAKCQAWPYWDAREGGVRMVPLVRWQYLYREWRERNIDAGT